jgi:hypothetical protein
MTKAIQRMEAEGHVVADQVLGIMSPYQTEHINRFGNYSLDFEGTPEPINFQFRKPPQEERPAEPALQRATSKGT